MLDDPKADVEQFWDEAACGEELYLKGQEKADYERHAQSRYELEPYIKDFLRPSEWRGKQVLEIGVGLGADHQMLAESGAVLSGIDLTDRAVQHTERRLSLFGAKSDLKKADAENLPFKDGQFDLVYAWGVIHHSPDTVKAAREILRVLKPGGEFRVMIYHKHSMVGLMLWLRYALLAGKPFTPLAKIYAERLESPGTKAYSPKQAKALFQGATGIDHRIILTHADLLEGGAGQRHRGLVIQLAKRLWPRPLLRAIAARNGLFLLLSGKKAKF